ncbi:MAG: FkbM family methyltransferase [Chloroflexia bacterium]|nr:FkbM family methyltransferase [Chloroflexia bacterium]
MKNLLPDVKVISFEAQKDFYLKLAAKTNHLNNIQHYCVALGDENKTSVFHKNEYSGASSILESHENLAEIFPACADFSKEKVEMVKLDDFIKHNRIELKKNILMKIDVQGFELNVLKGASEILSSIFVVIAEVNFINLYKKQCRFSDIYSF